MPALNDDHDQRTPIRVALIGLAGTVLAAVIGGVFLLLLDDSGPATPSQQSTVPQSTTNQSPATSDGLTTTSVGVESTTGDWAVFYGPRTFRFPCELYVYLDLDIPAMNRPPQGSTKDMVYNCTRKYITRQGSADFGLASVADPGPEQCSAAVDEQPTERLRVREGLRFCVRTNDGLIGFLEVVQVSGSGVLTVQARAWEPASDSVENG